MKTSSNSKFKRIAVVVSILLALIAASLVSYMIANNSKQPERSIANFCSLVAKEKNNLMSIEVTNSQKYISYSDLEKVSPNEIVPTVKEIRDGYRQMADNPASSASVNVGLSANFTAFNSFVNKNCPNI